MKSRDRKEGFDPNRYTVQKNEFFQDPRALYLTLRLDQHATDPVHVRAVRAALLEHFIPAIKDHNPAYAAGLKETIEALNQIDFTFPQNGTRQQIPQPGSVYLKQGAGFHQITGLSIDPRTDEIMVHTRSCEAPKNMMATLVPLDEFFQVEAADGIKVRTWTEVDPETGEPLTPALVQCISDQVEAAADDASQDQAADDEVTNPNAQAANQDQAADVEGETNVSGSDGGPLPETSGDQATDDKGGDQATDDEGGDQATDDEGGDQATDDEASSDEQVEAADDEDDTYRGYNEQQSRGQFYAG